jgi:iron(III) transport system permease protein
VSAQVDPRVSPPGPLEAPATRGRRTGPAGPADARRGWLLVTLLLAAAVVTPVGLVAASVLDPSTEVWRLLWQTELPEMLVTTVALMVCVVAGTVAVGAVLALVVGHYRFPGQRAFSWLLVLPLAVPAYVLGFVYVGLLDHPGPVQSALRGWFGADVWFPPVRSFPMAVVVLVLALYPYVYLLARAALREQSATTYEAARVLGHGPLTAVRRVVLPLARPSLAAGGALVAMETLTDYATVQYFNVTTASVGISQVWNGMYDRDAASEIASLVLLFAVAVVVLERLARGRARYTQEGSGRRPVEPVRLHGWRAWSAAGVCAAVVAVTFVVPVTQLVLWAMSAAETSAGGLDPRYLAYFGNSLLVAGTAAAICAAVGVVLASATRLSSDRTTRALARAATVGYAVPGPVVAVGVLLLVAGADAVLDALGLPGGGVLVTGTVVALVYAYVVRFLALSYNSVDASLDKLAPSLTAAALTLGASPRSVVRRVHVPLVRSGVGVALVLVAVDALKELPIVLLLRPFGFETLAVWVFQFASESRWEEAGLPALTIVLVALVPVVLLFRRVLNPGEEVSS